MTDQYTVYPEALKQRIGMANKYFEDRKAEEERWAALTPEQQAAEIKEAERINALPPEQQEEELKKLEAAKPPINPPPPEETVESLQDKLSKSEAALSTLKGKYEKEPTELARQNSFLTDQLKLLQQEVLKLKEQVKKPAAEPPKRIVLSEVLEKDYEEFKKELDPTIADRIIKLNERVFELARTEAQQSISEVASKVDSKFALSAKDQFDKDLRDAYPDWETMWRTPEFQAFGHEEIPEAGVERFVLIEDAFTRGNSRRVLKAFDLFTGKKKAAVTEDEHKVDEGKLNNRLSPPSSSSPGGQQPTKKPNQMSPQEARTALVTLSANYSRGQYVGSKEQYDKEYAKLSELAKARPGTG